MSRVHCVNRFESIGSLLPRFIGNPSKFIMLKSAEGHDDVLIITISDANEGIKTE